MDFTSAQFYQWSVCDYSIVLKCTSSKTSPKSSRNRVITILRDCADFQELCGFDQIVGSRTRAPCQMPCDNVRNFVCRGEK